MKKHFLLISVGVLNFFHGLIHLIQFIQSLIFVANATQEHHEDEGLLDTILHSPVFAGIMGVVGLLTLIIGIKDYIHHKKCHDHE